jgi:hypothetical protein
MCTHNQNTYGAVAMPELETKPKRKTSTSSAVHNRYKKKTYTRLIAELPKQMVEDFKELLAEKGDTVTGVVRAAVTEYIDKNSNKPGSAR